MSAPHVCILQTSFAKREDTVAFLKEKVLDQALAGAQSGLQGGDEGDLGAQRHRLLGHGQVAFLPSGRTPSPF